MGAAILGKVAAPFVKEVGEHDFRGAQPPPRGP